MILVALVGVLRHLPRSSRKPGERRRLCPKSSASQTGIGVAQAIGCSNCGLGLAGQAEIGASKRTESLDAIEGSTP